VFIAIPILRVVCRPAPEPELRSRFHSLCRRLLADGMDEGRMSGATGHAGIVNDGLFGTNRVFGRINLALLNLSL
jgi:hypothetical protein